MRRHEKRVRLRSLRKHTIARPDRLSRINIKRRMPYGVSNRFRGIARICLVIPPIIDICNEEQLFIVRCDPDRHHSRGMARCGDSLNAWHYLRVELDQVEPAAYVWQACIRDCFSKAG